MSFVRALAPTTAEIPFELISVDETAAPDGCEGTWQRYVISQGTNKIVGVRCGLREDVCVAVTELVAHLNLRLAKSAPARKFGRSSTPKAPVKPAAP
jgi:hypothetical protein